MILRELFDSIDYSYIRRAVDEQMVETDNLEFKEARALQCCL